MADRHKLPPVCFRPPEADRQWLASRARETGQPVSKILAEALAGYRAATEKSEQGRNARKEQRNANP